jgi:hypothetical protein
MVPIYFVEIKVVHVLTQSSAFAKCLDADDVGAYCTVMMIRQIQCFAANARNISGRKHLFECSMSKCKCNDTHKDEASHS